MILLLIGLLLLGLLAYDAYRTRRCAWCGHHVPAWRAPDHFYTHHLNHPKEN